MIFFILDLESRKKNISGKFVEKAKRKFCDQHKFCISYLYGFCDKDKKQNSRYMLHNFSDLPQYKPAFSIHWHLPSILRNVEGQEPELLASLT
jgi:hypothetical protein